MELEHKKIWLKGLLVDCTFGEVLHKCPAWALRLLPIEERMDRVNVMLEEEIDKAISLHTRCVAKRAGRIPDFYG